MSTFMQWVNELNEQGVFCFNPYTGCYEENMNPPAPTPAPDTYESVKIVERLDKRYEFTHDFAIIRQHKYVPVFIYQYELLQNGQNSGILISSDSKWLGKAHSTHPVFTLWDVGEEVPRRTLVFPNTDKHQNGLLKGTFLSGEVYAVTPEDLLDLDRYMQNTEETDRVEKTFVLDDQESPFKDGQKPTLKCWIYVGHEPFFDKFKKNKRPVVNNNGKYYFVP